MKPIPTKGVYVLVLEINEDICVDVGSLGHVCFEEGVYGYIGSAKGFGGIEARIKHHIAKDKKRLWWHIDYLTSRRDVIVKYVVYVENLAIDEEDVVRGFSSSSCWSIAIPRFGSTDKKSSSHFFECVCGIDSCVEDLKNVFISLGLEPHIMDVSGFSRMSKQYGEVG